MADRTSLTDVAIRKMTPPAEGQAETWDKKVPGFGVRVTPAGTKSFVFLYRIEGRPRRLTLGRYPDTTLAKARDLAQQALAQVRRGLDPQVSVPSGSAMFRAVLDEFVEAHCARHNRASTAKETERLLRSEFLPLWEERGFSEIRKADVLSAIDAIVKRGTPSAANHAFAAIRKLFNWAVGRGYIELSPCIGISRPAKQNSRDRVLGDHELLALWSAAEQVGYPFGSIFQLLALTAQRRGEVAGMRWSDLELAERTWTIPAELTKNNRQHTVPLTPAALMILNNLPRFHDVWVFPARGDNGPYVGFSKAKRRLDKLANVKRRLDANANKETTDEVEDIEWTLHDLRRTAATGMGKLGVPPHVVERVLNHASGQFKGVAGIYNRFGYLPEMRAALEKWEAHVRPVVKLPA